MKKTTKKTAKKPITVSEMGKKGGKVTFKKLGKTGMSKLGKKGAKARWGK